MIHVFLHLLRCDRRPIERVFTCGDAIGSIDPYLPYRWSSVDLDLAASMGIVLGPISIHHTKPLASETQRWSFW
jgi:hypothetical protein